MSARGEPRGRSGLKLRARDAEDLQAIAACLQDALVPLVDTAFLKAERRFVMVANRFRWEAAPVEAPAPEDLSAEPRGEAPEDDARFDDANGESGALYERVNCGLCFDEVRKVQVRGLNPRDRGQILSILTLNSAPGEITLIFAGGPEIRLQVDRIRCHLEDLSEPWPTRWQPGHDLDDVAAPGRE